MPSLYKATATNTEAEEEGHWVDYDRVPGVRLLIARDGNKKHQAWVDKKMLPLFRRYRDGNIPLKVRDPIALEGRARFLLLDWEGVDDEETGMPIEATLETKMRYMKELRDFSDDVEFLSRQAESYKINNEEDDSKN